MEKMANTRAGLTVVAMMTLIGLMGCGGGGSTGGGLATGSSNTPSVTAAPPPATIATSGVPVPPTAVITIQAADRLAKLTTEAFKSVIKTSLMYGILNMTNPWPLNSVSPVNCGASAGYVTWLGSDVTLMGAGSVGRATYTGCDSGSAVGPISGSINLTYTRYVSPTDFAVDLTQVINVTSIVYSHPNLVLLVGANYSFTGFYDFNQGAPAGLPTGLPTYAVDTTNFGKQRVIGQPVLQHISSNDTNIAFDGNNNQGFGPVPVLVRSFLNATDWVEVQFGHWDVDISSGQLLPASTCTVIYPCVVTITAKNGGQAIINATGSGNGQSMSITPASGGAASSVPVTF